MVNIRPYKKNSLLFQQGFSHCSKNFKSLYILITPRFFPVVSKEQAAKEKRIADGVKEILAFRGFKVTNTVQDEDYIDVYGEKTEEGGKITIDTRTGEYVTRVKE